MENNSTKTQPFLVIQGGRAETGKLPKTLTRKDVREFLADFVEAILVDQLRVNKLSRSEFHPRYNHAMWKRNREDHVAAIVRLYTTVEDMPNRLLKRLTDLAIAYKPDLVKTLLLNIISDVATGVGSVEPSDTAPLFFKQLIRDVSRRAPDLLRKESPRDLMRAWFDYNDPIQISEDDECEYSDLLISAAMRESVKLKRTLAMKSRRTFVQMVVDMQFVGWFAAQPEWSDE